MKKTSLILFIFILILLTPYAAFAESRSESTSSHETRGYLYQKTNIYSSSQSTPSSIVTPTPQLAVTGYLEVICHDNPNLSLTCNWTAHLNNDKITSSNLKMLIQVRNPYGDTGWTNLTTIDFKYSVNPAAQDIYNQGNFYYLSANYEYRALMSGSVTGINSGIDVLSPIYSNVVWMGGSTS